MTDIQSTRSSRERLRILKYPWHAGHDYELSKLDAEFFLICSTHRKWSVAQRPIPPSINLVPDVDSVETDLLLLHVDQWTWTELDKRFLFLNLRDNYPGRKVIINHGSNGVDGCSTEIMREMTAGLPVVCNSLSAKNYWNLPNCVYIRHGMTPSEWPASNYGHNNIVITQPSGAIHSTFRNRDAVSRFEAERGVKVSWIGRDLSFRNFDSYVSYLATSSVYFNCSYVSPNPRARTEAMMCGLAIVTTNGNGEDEYIRDGENGFVSNDMEKLYDALVYLNKNPKEAQRMGRNARETAHEIFHIDRFRARWRVLLENVMAGNDIAGLQDKLSAL